MAKPALHRQHGVVVLAKFDSWCWWPALIVDEKKVMPKIEDAHNLSRGSCMVCFFPEDAYNKVSVRQVKDFLPNLRSCIDEAEPRNLYSVIDGVKEAVRYIKSPNSLKHYVTDAVVEQQKELLAKLANDSNYLPNLYDKGQERIVKGFTKGQKPVKKTFTTKQGVEVIDLLSDPEDGVQHNEPRIQSPHAAGGKSSRNQLPATPQHPVKKNITNSSTKLPKKKPSNGRRGKKRKRVTQKSPKAAVASPAARAVVPSEEITSRIIALQKRGTTKEELRKLNYSALAEAAAAFLIGYDSEFWKEFDALRIALGAFFREALINGVTASGQRLEKLEARFKNELNINLGQVGITTSAVLETLPVFFKHICSSDG